MRNAVLRAGRNSRSAVDMAQIRSCLVPLINLNYRNSVEYFIFESSMSVPSIKKPKDPLEGKTLERIVTELQSAYGWEGLAQEIPINCFDNNPSIKSSLTFLRKTPWARSKVEKLYLAYLKRV